MSNYDEFTLAWVMRTSKVNATLNKMQETINNLIRLSKLSPKEYSTLSDTPFSNFNIRRMCIQAENQFLATLNRTNTDITRVIWMSVNLDSGRRDESWRPHLNIAKDNLEAVKLVAQNNLAQIKYLFSPLVRIDTWTIHFLNIKSSLQNMKEIVTFSANAVELKNWLNQVNKLQTDLIMLIIFMDGYYIPKEPNQLDLDKIVSRAHMSIVDLDNDIKLLILNITTAIIKNKGSFSNFYDIR